MGGGDHNEARNDRAGATSPIDFEVRLASWHSRHGRTASWSYSFGPAHVFLSLSRLCAGHF